MNASGTNSLTAYFSERICSWATVLFRTLPPEMAHNLAIRVFSSGMFKRFFPLPLDIHDLSFQVHLPHLGSLPHPICLAAGFDKNAIALEGLSHLNFAMLEAGTITPRAQPGNKKPRLFRQEEQSAIINRMGFNNVGCDKALANVQRYKNNCDVPLGMNLGKNKDTPLSSALDDYLTGMETFAESANYFVINVSSPNTPGLRDLSSPDFVNELARAIGAHHHILNKVYVKLDPDMPKKQFQLLVETLCDAGFGGVILTNTHSVSSPQRGGLSGHPLAIKSTLCLEWAYEVHKGSLPMIGSGGVLSGSDIYQKLIRGASAVQVYSALVYRGPMVVWSLLTELSYEMKLRKIAFLNDVIGQYYDDPSLS